MKKILYITNIPSPYRVKFFDGLGQHVDLTVLTTDGDVSRIPRTAEWYVESRGNFSQVTLKKGKLRMGGENLCPDVISWLKKPFDHIVVCGYSSPTAVLAMLWLRMKRIPFFMEVDGGLIREDRGLRYRIKRFLVTRPSAWISSGRWSDRYLTHYGADPDRIQDSPFSSLEEKDILSRPDSREEKLALRRELGMEEERIVLSVGRPDYGKGFDVLMRAAAKLPENVGVYLVGGQPTPELLELSRELGLTHLHFLDFRKPEVLRTYYRAADVFALATRSDVWGLVVNESMACGLPVVTTDRCVAGLELVENGVNGYIVPTEDHEALAEKILAVLNADGQTMGAAALETIRPYTIRSMVEAHAKIFE